MGNCKGLTSSFGLVIRKPLIEVQAGLEYPGEEELSVESPGAPDSRRPVG